MLDIQFIREKPDVVKEAIRAKRIGEPELVDQILSIDATWRGVATELQTLKTELNDRGKRVGDLMRAGKKTEAETLVAENSALKSRSSSLEQALRDAAAERSSLLLEVPNVPHASVPEGASPADNVETFAWGEHPSFDFTPKPHWDIIESRGFVDFERGSKVTGAGFPFYVGSGAKLQRALISFFLDRAGSDGNYTEIQAPLFVNAASATATGQLPDKEDQMYEAARDGLYAIPTAEIPITNFHRDEIVAADEMPIRYCGYTPCFRREAGSYGKDVRGLNRLHQFDKVELVQFVDPEKSYDVLEEMREHAEHLLQLLELPYRRLLMCTADMGFTQAKKYDLEVWSAGQERWLEVSSISNFEDFQARRANIRFKDGSGKPRFVHTLNGSALALPRIVAALLENGQLADGRVTVPTVLRDYLNAEVL